MSARASGASHRRSFPTTRQDPARHPGRCRLLRNPAPRPYRRQTPFLERAVNAYLNVWNAVFRFLASLKLAIFSIATLAAVLAYSTFFEKFYGTAAVQEWIYRSKGFAVLLLFLGMNILCAALIRYPWKKRQTGFVITHAGLLTVLAGSLVTFQLADEGQVSLLEGEQTSRLVRIDHPRIRLRQIDRETGTPTQEYAVSFRPTNFDWKPGTDRPQWRARLDPVRHLQGIQFFPGFQR